MGTERIFDLRTYVAAPGRFGELKRRFAEHTIGYFERHGMEVIAFLEPVDADDTLVYLLAYPSEAAAEAAWKAFHADPGWLAARAASEVDGPLTASIESRRFVASEFSPLR